MMKDEGVEEAGGMPHSRDSSVSRYAVIVLGMHRSGTSALSRVLSLAGCTLPRNLMAANINNEPGYWESQAVAELDEEVLLSADSSWHDVLPFKTSWYTSPIYPDFVRRGGEVLAQEYGTSPLFVLKDPRICRLAPLWLDVLERANVRPAVVIALRNPLEVAQSLARRDGMHEGHAQLLWLRHVLDAEASSRGLARAVCTYDQLLTDQPAMFARLEQAFGFSWPRQSVETTDRINQFLGARYRHEHHGQLNHGMAAMAADWIRQTYAILLTWAEDGESQDDFAALDAMRAAFNEATQALAGPLHGLITDRTRLREIQGAQASTLAEYEASSHAREAAMAEVERECAALRQSLQEADAQRDAWALRTDENAIERQALEDRIAGLETDLGDARHRLSEMESAALQRNEEVRQVWEELDGQRAAVAQRDQAIGDLTERLAISEQHAAEVARNEQEALRRLAESEAWAWGLARDRRLAEGLAAAEKNRSEQAEQETLQARIGLERAEGMLESLNQAVHESEAEVRRKDDLVRWLHRVFSTLDQQPFWWSLLSRDKRRDREYRTLAQAGLFDRDAYLSRYPDVASACVDPLQHYIERGMAEGRIITS